VLQSCAAEMCLFRYQTEEDAPVGPGLAAALKRALTLGDGSASDRPPSFGFGPGHACSPRSGPTHAAY